MIQKLEWQAAIQLVNRARHVLLICHVSPDGDAIGSLLAMGKALHTLGKETTLACESEIPAKFEYLPGHKAIVHQSPDLAIDLIISLDCSDTRRLGRIYDENTMADIPLVNIDHHKTNLFFGQVNLVDVTAVSTTQIILPLLDQMGVALDLEMATCLLYGIVTDTIGFRTANITTPVMSAVTRLMQAGASLAEITHVAFNQLPLNDLKLLNCGLDRMQVQDGLLWSDIPLSVRSRCGHQGNGDAGLASMLARTQGTCMSAVFCETQDGRVEVSLRAAPGFNVAQIALSFGGGGHPTAAGFSTSGPLEAAKERVLAMLQTTLEEQKAKSAAPLAPTN